MTEEQINIAIAEECGWEGHPFCKDMMGNHFPGWDTPPNYCNDLNAMHEAEKMLTCVQARIYAFALYDLANGFKVDEDPWTPDIFEASMDGVAEMVCATALQRAEAFLKTVGKWKEQN